MAIGGAIAGSALVGLIQGERARKDAKRANRAAVGQQNRLLDFLREQYYDEQENRAPFLQAARETLPALQTAAGEEFDPSTILDSPLASRLLNLSTRAVENSAAARGRLNSVETGENIARNALTSVALPLIGTSANIRNNRFNRLASLAGFGTIPAPSTAGIQGASNSLSNLIGNQGTINAQGAFNTANVLNQGIGNLLFAKAGGLM